MINVLNRIWRDRRGNALIIATAALPLLIGSAGLAVDTIQWALWKRQLQRAADSAAIAGVYTRMKDAGSTSGASAAVSHDLVLDNHTNIALLTSYPKVTFPANAGGNTNAVKVQLAIQRTLSFSSMFTNTPVIKAAATAATVPGNGNYCVVSLEHTSKTGIMGSGSGTVDMTCGMITNSSSTNSAAAQGSSKMKVTVIAAVGGIQQSNNWQVDKYDPYVPPIADPYASLTPVSSEMGCATNPPALTGGANGTQASAGCYSSMSVGSNKFLKLNPGTYFISGGGVNIQGTLTGTGVTIVLTNKSTATNATIGSIDMNAGAKLDISAPTSGKWMGMAIYQDRRATDPQINKSNLDSGSPNKLNGGGGAQIVGALYFPNQQLTYNGDGSLNYVCTQFVVKRILFSGNNSTANKFTDDCSGYGMGQVAGGTRVRLIA
jgi:Flp pilus assembly protein TadG